MMPKRMTKCGVAAVLALAAVSLQANDKPPLDGRYGTSWEFFDPQTSQANLKIKTNPKEANAVTMKVNGTTQSPVTVFTMGYSLAFSAKFVSRMPSGKGKITFNYDGEMSTGTGKYRAHGTSATLNAGGVTPAGYPLRIIAKFKKKGHTVVASGVWVDDTESIPFTLTFR